MVETGTVTVAEAAKLLGISRNSAYRAVSVGEIPSIRLGHRLVIPKAALERMLEGGHEHRAAGTEGMAGRD